MLQLGRPPVAPFAAKAGTGNPVCPRRTSFAFRSSVTCRVAAEHARFINEVAVFPGSPRIDLLLRVLQAQGNAPVPPSNRKDLHPLAIPLAAQSDGNTLICLLRWPEGHRGMELPVIAMARGAPTLQLLARSAEEYCHRALAQEEYDAQQQSKETSSSCSGPISQATGEEGAAIYEPGSVVRSGLPSLEAYLARKAGMFCDVAETLSLNHLKRGDTMSALVAAEWYMRQGHFPDWARPYEFAFGLLRDVGRHEESRDVARIALRSPWWTLKEGFAATRDAALLSGGADEVRAALDQQDEMANGGALKGMYKTNPKSEKQKIMDEAAHMLNRAAAAEAGWEDVREEVGNLYAKAGLVDVARFVKTV
jgi:hypothetical protein